MAVPQAWLYLDDRRTHVVRAAIVREPHLQFVIKESAFGHDGEDETYTTSHRMLDAWEAKMLQMRLEARLTFLGNYYRAEPGGGWTAVRSGAGHAPKGEILPIQRDGEARVEFHHYGKESEQRAVTLVGVPQETSKGARYVLARLDFAFPDVEGGHLQLLHSKLPPSVYRSAIASLHLELKELGIEKARAVEGSISADPRWWAALQAVLDAVLERLTEGRVGKGEAMGSPRRRDNVALAKAMGLMKEAQGAFGAGGGKFDTEMELDGPAHGVETRKGQVGLDEVQSTLLGVLNDAKLLALQNKMVSADQQKELIESGELAIKAAMKRKRQEMTPDQQHLLSLVEASLLVRSAISRKGAKIDLEVVEKLKHAPAWLS